MILHRNKLRSVFLTAGAIFLVGASDLVAQEAGKSGVVETVPAKIDGQWPNDARDTFWYCDYETASQVARNSQRPILLVINRGAICEV